MRVTANGAVRREATEAFHIEIFVRLSMRPTASYLAFPPLLTSSISVWACAPLPGVKGSAAFFESAHGFRWASAMRFLAEALIAWRLHFRA